MSNQQPVKAQTLKYTLYNKNSLTADEADLFELSQLAGVTFDAKVFKIIVDLLRLNVAPTAIERMLKSMTQQHSKKGQSGSMKMPLESGDNTTTVSSSRGRHSSSGSSSKSSRSSHR